jgi:hypothetical protein
MQHACRLFSPDALHRGPSQQALGQVPLLRPAMAEVLKAELIHLRNAIAHLEKSIAELKLALATEGPDPEYTQAINENIMVLAKQRARQATLEEEIAKVEGAGSSSMHAAQQTVASSMQIQQAAGPPSMQQTAHESEGAPANEGAWL